jgi:hypothetical protein
MSTCAPPRRQVSSSSAPSHWQQASPCRASPTRRGARSRATPHPPRTGCSPIYRQVPPCRDGPLRGPSRQRQLRCLPAAAERPPLRCLSRAASLGRQLRRHPAAALPGDGDVAKRRRRPRRATSRSDVARPDTCPPPGGGHVSGRRLPASERQVQGGTCLVRRLLPARCARRQLPASEVQGT